MNITEYIPTFSETIRGLIVAAVVTICGIVIVRMGRVYQRQKKESEEFKATMLEAFTLDEPPHREHYVFMRYSVWRIGLSDSLVLSLVGMVLCLVTSILTLLFSNVLIGISNISTIIAPKVLVCKLCIADGLVQIQQQYDFVIFLRLGGLTVLAMGTIFMLMANRTLRLISIADKTFRGGFLGWMQPKPSPLKPTKNPLG